MKGVVTNHFLSQIVPDNMRLCLSKERSCPDPGRPKLSFRNLFFGPAAGLSIERAIALAAEEKDTNWFFGVGGFDNSQRRRAVNVLGMRSLFLDVDLKKGPKYFNSKADVIPALRNLHTTCPYLPSPWLVDSGHGVHVYYTLNKTLTTEQWSPLASLFASVVRAVEPKLIADSTRTRDAASVMRLPLSWNAKTYDRLLVKVVREGSPADVDAIRETLAAAAAVHNLSGVDAVIGNELMPNMSTVPGYMDVDADQEFGEGMENPLRQEFTDLDLRPIIKGCKQMRSICETKGNVPEPQWLNFLRVLNTVKNSDDVACHFSSGHPTYSESGTRRKMRHIRDNFETATTSCEEFRYISKSGCYNCPSFNKVWTPSQLAVVEAQNIEEKAAIAEARESAVSGITTSQGYIPQHASVRQKLTAGAGHEVTFLPVRQPGKKAVLLHEEVISGHIHAVQSSAKIENKVVDHIEAPTISDVTVHLDIVSAGYKNRVVCTSKELTGTGYDGVTESLRTRGLVFESTYPAQRAATVGYLHELVRLSTSRRVLYRPDKGWLKIGNLGEWSFVAGARHYLADGSTENNITGAEHYGASSASEGFMERNCSGVPRGRLDLWKRGMSVYNGNSMHIPQLLLLSGLSNLLMPLIPSAKGGIVLALTGEAAKGKTTLLEFMSSFMGNHMKFIVPGTTTTNALGALLQQANCMMLPVDDTISEDAEVFSALLAMVTGGTEKLRLIWNSETGGSTPFKDGFTTSILLSSNKSTAASIGSGGAGKNQFQTEAARSRTLEFPAESIKAPAHISKSDWDKAKGLVTNNYGHAVDLFMRHVVKHQKSISNELVRREEDLYKALSAKLETGKHGQVRFWARFLAVSMVTGRIVCEKLNLLPWKHLDMIYSGESLIGTTVEDNKQDDSNLIEDFWGCAVEEPNLNDPKINIVTRNGHERNMGPWDTSSRKQRVEHSKWSTGLIPNSQNPHLDTMMPAANVHNRWRIDAYDVIVRGTPVKRQRERTVFMPVTEVKNLVRVYAGRRLNVTDWSDLYTRLRAAGCIIHGVKPSQPDRLSKPPIRVSLGMSKGSSVSIATSVVEIRLPPQDITQ